MIEKYKKRIRFSVLLTVTLLVVYIGIDSSISTGARIDACLQNVIYLTEASPDDLRKDMYDFWVKDSISYDERSMRLNRRDVSFDENQMPWFPRLRIELEDDSGEKYYYKILILENHNHMNGIELSEINHRVPKYLDGKELRKGKELFEKKIINKLRERYPIKQQPSITEFVTIGAYRHMLQTICDEDNDR